MSLDPIRTISFSAVERLWALVAFRVRFHYKPSECWHLAVNLGDLFTTEA
eukprot:COSAG03_NODE_2508_length_2687_cov_4.686244_1_plen_50_part_00